MLGRELLTVSLPPRPGRRLGLTSKVILSSLLSVTDFIRLVETSNHPHE